jgi:hypothetical protein
MEFFDCFRWKFEEDNPAAGGEPGGEDQAGVNISSVCSPQVKQLFRRFAQKATDRKV